MDIRSLIQNLREDRKIYDAANNVRIQFGTRNQRFLFSQLMPERQVMERIISDEALTVRSVAAKDAPRNAPVTPRTQVKTGANLFELADSNSGAEFTGTMYEGLLKYLALADVNGVPGSEMAAMQLLDFMDTQVVRPLAIKREIYRSQAIVNARIIREGDGGFYEVVDYPNPAGRRKTIPSGSVGSPTGLYNGGYDVMEDIVDLRDSLLTTEGLGISQIVTTQKMMSQFSRHPIVQAYGGQVNLRDLTNGGTTAAGVAGVNPGALQPAAMQGALAYFGLPSVMGQNLWLYDSMYDVEETDKTKSRQRFIPDNVVILLCNTDRSETIHLSDDVEPAVLYDTLGYTAVGPVSGEFNPGVKVQMFEQERHPSGIIMEGVQCAFPILQEPDAIAVLTYPDPTA